MIKRVKVAYKLTHNNLIEYDSENETEISDVKLLGFFSSEECYKRAICEYLKQPGFCDMPDRFQIEQIRADIDDFNSEEGIFDGYLYYLCHEWYDGKYDYVSNLGYYSKKKLAEEAKANYMKLECFKNKKDGFEIDKFILDEMEWKEGFFQWT